MKSPLSITVKIAMLATPFVAGAVSLIPIASATAPQPVTWSYPALHGLCFLEAAAALDGVEAAYPIGHEVRTKQGKWVCTEAVARQAPVALAGVSVLAK